jgi:hypothetical protein
MKSKTSIQLPKKDIIEKIVDAIMLRGPMSRLGKWFDYKLFKNDVYELRGDEVVSHRQQRPQFKVHEVATWQQVFISFGVPLIVIKFSDGRMLELSDKHDDILHILQHAIPERELPWKAI